ncbi:MAG: FtsX-like permease family protein [Rhodanobacteraceae bacterium]|nr:MAG: FtsX-like permease family protein [Rhodanobacteraceae bacterium]
MNLPPTLAALRKHKAGVFLIGLQVALTLAITCNLVFIVTTNAGYIHRPTGLDEINLFLIGQSFANAPVGDDAAALEKLDSMQLTDLATLRGLPDVQDVSPVSSMPLTGSTNSADVSLKPAQMHGLAKAALFWVDDQIIPTFGLQLVAGRDFTSADVRHLDPNSKTAPPLVIVSQALAHKLYPHGDAVGKPIWLNQNTAPSTIVGVVARLFTSSQQAHTAAAYYTILIPARIDAATTLYAVRTRPGRMRQAMDAARKALFRVDPLRIMQPNGKYSIMGLHTFAQIRAKGYALEIALVQILTAITVILLLVTGVGITGLTSFWVGQRHKQIGIRRALGATRANILHYFQIENLIIAGGGCVVGVVLAIGIDLMLLKMFQTDHRMPVWYVAIGVIVILLLGQLAVFAPARRASKVPPVVATRSV